MGTVMQKSLRSSVLHAEPEMGSCESDLLRDGPQEKNEGNRMGQERKLSKEVFLAGDQPQPIPQGAMECELYHGVGSTLRQVAFCTPHHSAIDCWLSTWRWVGEGVISQLPLQPRKVL